MAEKTKTETATEEKKLPDKQRNIYEKMAAVKIKLVGIKKGGESNYIKGGYFELADILPILTPALKDERLFMQTQFSATEQIATLIIIDIDKTEDRIEYEMKFTECNIKGIHEIQNQGATQTYIRRYLILTAFDISDGDLLDSEKTEIDEKKAAQKKDEEQRRAAEKKNQQKPPEQTPPDAEKELEHLRRSSWNLIKKLPAEEQPQWIDQCKGASADTLKQIIQAVDGYLYKLQQANMGNEADPFSKPSTTGASTAETGSITSKETTNTKKIENVVTTERTAINEQELIIY